MASVFMEVTKRKKITERLARWALFVGIVYFGLIFPNPFANHESIVHFGAHVGMSFLLASCIYVICNVRLRISRTNSYIILLVTIFIVGSLYKYFEIAGEGMFVYSYSLGQLLQITGCYASMSQNIAGALAAILLISYLADQFRLKINPAFGGV
jgi:hypothetical protein